MPVVNIKDSRENQNDVKCNVVFEPAWNDNDAPNATQFAVETADFDVDEVNDTTIAEAIKYANSRWYETPVIMYIYDVE